MRYLLIIHFVFVACLLTAQSKAPDPVQSKQNYPAPTQSAPPPAQKQVPRDCYVRKLDAGTSALRRGDNQAALRLFEEAKGCPEVQGNSRRTNELDSKIEQLKAMLGKKNTAQSSSSDLDRKTEEIEVTRRTFQFSKAFVRNTDENCFQITVKEADRAFGDSCWNVASKLYRAAKNCADANQSDRERMNARIEACTEAEADELLQKEQKAVRTARHAIADKLASDAASLLRKGDRSLAWRLADFSNFFVAPDDNPRSGRDVPHLARQSERGGRFPDARPQKQEVNG